MADRRDAVRLSWLVALLLAAACTPKPVATPDAIDDVADAAVDDVAVDIDVAPDAALTDTMSPSDIVDAKDIADVAVPDVDASVDPPLDVTAGSPDGMVYIPGGTFWMGCNEAKATSLGMKCESNAQPQHKVTLSPYYIDPLEVTRAMYAACVDAGLCGGPGDASVPLDWPTNECPLGAALYAEQLDHPVICLSRDQARRFCQWRGSKFDLPTEAQWEMAARGDCEHNGSTADDPGCAEKMRVFPWGDVKPTPTTGCDYAVMSIDISGSPLCSGDVYCVKDGCAEPPNVFPNLSPGGTKLKGDSPYGVHDLAGNVAEYVRDDFEAYSAAPSFDPAGKYTKGTSGLIRGGWAGSNLGSGDLAAHGRVQLGGLWSAARGVRCIRAAD